MNTIPNRKIINNRERIIAHGQQFMARKGFCNVSLNEVLISAKLSKGTFYHYFDSKDAFGVAVLDNYFEWYFTELDSIFSGEDATVMQNLLKFWTFWQEDQCLSGNTGSCLAVRLSLEVADISESMRFALVRGISTIIERLANAIQTGIEDGSLFINDKPNIIAQSLFEIWMGASVLAKILRNPQPFEDAMGITSEILRGPTTHLNGSTFNIE